MITDHFDFHQSSTLFSEIQDLTLISNLSENDLISCDLKSSSCFVIPTFFIKINLSFYHLVCQLTKQSPGMGQYKKLKINQ